MVTRPYKSITSSDLSIQQSISSLILQSISSSSTMTSNSSLQISGSPSSPLKRMRKLGGPSATRQEESFVPFSELSEGGGFTTKAMVCRRWEASNTAGKYINTEYVLSDNTGGAIHCIVRSSIAHCFVSKLEVGQVFSLSRFTVHPNKESYRLRNSDPHLIQLEGNSLVKQIDCPTTGFVRYPVQLVDIEAIGLNGNRFLIDVIGKVVNIGRAKPTRNGSQFLEFELMNERSVTQFWRLQFPSEDCHNNQKPTKWRDRNFLWLADEFYRSSIPLYLPKLVFCHGQLYVAISRETDPKGLKILILSEKHPQNYTRNIVYKEAFNNLPAQPQTTHKEIQQA